MEAADPAVATHISVAPVPQLSIRGGEGLVRDAVGDRPVLDGDTINVVDADGGANGATPAASTRRRSTLVDDTPDEFEGRLRDGGSGLDPLAGRLSAGMPTQLQR